MSTDAGRFVLARSDHLSMVIDKPNTPYVIGRSSGLPAPQQLPAKYASREQLSVTWQPPSLVVRQLGKNPTFFAPDSLTVPRDGQPVLEFRGAAGISEPTVQQASDGHTVVSLPMCDPIHATTAPPLTQHDAGTFFFPAEVGLPCIAVRCERTQATLAETREGASAATSSLTAAQMLAVPAPTPRGGGADSDDDDNTGTQTMNGSGVQTAVGAPAGSGTKPQWQGLLDAAMQQKHRQEAAEQQQQQPQAVQNQPATEQPPPKAPAPVRAEPAKRKEQPPVQTTAVAPVVEPPSTISSAVANVPVAAAVSVAPKQQQQQAMGFWEWKCHANGPDHDPKSWRKYPLAVAKLLEEAYHARKTVVPIPDSALGLGGRKHDRDDDHATADGGASTYSVCLKEASLGGGMVQFQNDDKGRFRVVRRTGGDVVDWHGVKAAHIIPQSSSSSSSSSSDDDDDDESEFSESESESVSEELSDSEPKAKKAKRKAK